MAYATSADLIARYDVRTIAELATDDDVPLSRADVLTHRNVLSALTRASGDVDVALRSGARYTPEQLVALDEHSAAHLADIVCTIAMQKLFRRRPGVHAEMADAIRKDAAEAIKLLATGVNVFGLQDDQGHIEAGLMDVKGPTTVQIGTRNFLASRMAGRHLAPIEQSQPLDRG